MTVYLTDVSPVDAPWDNHRANTDRIRDFYQGSDFNRLAERANECSRLLEFAMQPDLDTGELKAKLRSARFCRVRFCPTCQWRKSLMWVARFRKAIPAITQMYPNGRWLFMTFTVKNCQVDELRQTISSMLTAFNKLTRRNVWPALGWLRKIEVTCGSRGAVAGEAHPHLHVLALVPSSYFGGNFYINHEGWVRLWREVAKLDYDPIVNVKAVKPRRESIESGLLDSIRETLKYSVKPDDLASDREWLLAVTRELHKTRSLGLGGCFKGIMSESEPDTDEEMVHTNDSEDISDQDLESWFFSWAELARRYAKIPR